MKKLLFLPLLFAFIFSACTKSPLPDSSLPSSQDTSEQQAVKLAQIIDSGASARCIITDLTTNLTSEYYVSGKKMKIISSDTGPGQPGIVINDGQYVYAWQEGQTTGFKNKIPTEEEIDSLQSDYGEYQSPSDIEKLETESNFQVNCQKANFTDSDFTPPSDVNFIDPTEMNPSDLMDFNPETMMPDSQ